MLTQAVGLSLDSGFGFGFGPFEYNILTCAKEAYIAYPSLMSSTLSLPNIFLIYFFILLTHQ